LTSSRVPNMICHFDAFLRLRKLFPRFVYAQFGQYALDDSPLNKIERMWATESKKLKGLYLSPCAEGDSSTTSLLRISEQEKRVKFFAILNKAMSSVKERLESIPSQGDRELLRVRTCTSRFREGSGPARLHVVMYYAEIMTMSFQYASKKKLQSDPALQNMLNTYRLMCAHTDRHRLSMSIITIVPHLHGQTR
jgi:hypothetical protein